MIINQVVDSLHLRIMRMSSPSDFVTSNYAEWREYIDNFEHGKDPVFVELDGIGTFRLLSYTRAPYGVVLDSAEIGTIRVWNPDKWCSDAAHNTGQIFLDFRSQFLQLYGLDAAQSVIDAVINVFFANPIADGFVRVARLDLAVDTAEEDQMSWSDMDKFVCRTKKIDSWATITPANLKKWLEKDAPSSGEKLLDAAGAAIKSFLRDAMRDVESQDSASLTRIVTDGRNPKTIYFGRFGSKLYGRRYDKLASLVVQDKLYMLQEWINNGWDGKSHVIRTEFSLSGDFLREFRVEGVDCVDYRDFALIEGNLSHIWHYLTHYWLRQIELGTDSNLSRCETSKLWQIIQSAFAEREKVGVYRDYKRRDIKETDHLIKQIRGCMITAVAVRHGNSDKASTNDYDDALQSVIDDVIIDYATPNFILDFEERLAELAVDKYSDTAFTTFLRADRIREGNGS